MTDTAQDPMSKLDAADALAGGAMSAQPRDPLSKLDMADAIANGKASPPLGHGASGSWADGPSAGERFLHGVADIPTGLGQLAEHVAETPLNGLRAAIRGSLNAVGAPNAAALFSPVTSDDFDRIVAQREADYQRARADAQQNGIDWWRGAGQLVATAPAAFVGAPAATAGGRIMQGAAMGAGLGATQPSTNQGNFWLDKAKDSAIGAVLGGGLSTMAEAITPVLRKAVSAARGYFTGTNASVVAANNANTVVNEALRTNGIDPNTVNLDILKGLRGETADALRQGGDVSATSIVNRAEAQSLPQPIELTRGQASGDAMQFAKERNLRGIQGVGEPITQRLSDQNSQLIANLDLLGARNAPDVVSTGQALADRIRAVDGYYTNPQGTGVIDRAYAGVKTNAGQSASLNHEAFANSVRDALGTDYRFLPREVQSLLEDIEGGKIPFNVSTAQSLDKTLTGLQSGAPISNTVDHALGVVKSKIIDTPIDDSLGQGAMQAYQAAKALAKERFNLIDQNPAYKAVLSGVRTAEPDQLFNRFVMSGTAREIQSLGQLADLADKVTGGQATGSGTKLIGDTLIGEVRRQVVSGVGDRAVLSGNALNKFVGAPVWNAKLAAALPDGVVVNLERLNRVAANVQRAPAAAAVNTSNTGSALANFAKAAGKTLLEETPVIGGLVRGVNVVRGVARNLGGAQQQMVQAALNPGVTATAAPRTLSGLLGMKPAPAASAYAGRAATIAANARRQSQE